MEATETAAFPAIEAPKPVTIIDAHETDSFSHVAIPPGWSVKEIDDQHKLMFPRRKAVDITLTDLDSFTAYVLRHSIDETGIYCDANFVGGKINFKAIINDHGPAEGGGHWRDHTANFEPRKSVEWNRWISHNGPNHTFSQAQFAEFIEENGTNIAAVDGQPTGAQMLEMALNMEANQDVRFKSAIRLHNGGVQLSFVQDDDAQTLARMELFRGFSIGIPVFWNGAAFRIDARLRYRAMF